MVADFPARELLVTTVMVQKVSPTWPYESGGVLVFDSSFFFFFQSSAHRKWTSLRINWKSLQGEFKKLALKLSKPKQEQVGSWLQLPSNSSCPAEWMQFSSA